MTELERMLSGQLYFSADPKLTEMRNNARKLCRQYNNTDETQQRLRSQLLDKMFARKGNNSYIEPPFTCDYGCHISVGDNFYANFGCVILDVNKVTIGNNVMLAPSVHIFTATHPTDATVRNSGLELGQPITIGDNVWIGGATVINPGVTIGNNCVIGSGSVVTHDIPDNSIAVGNPCRVIKSADADSSYWKQQADNYYSTKQQDDSRK